MLGAYYGVWQMGSGGGVDDMLRLEVAGDTLLYVRQSFASVGVRFSSSA